MGIVLQWTVQCYRPTLTFSRASWAPYSGVLRSIEGELEALQQLKKEPRLEKQRDLVLWLRPNKK